MASIATAPPTLTDDEVTVEKIPMSYDEYLAWFDKDAGRRGEWVDGEMIRFVSTTLLHENLVGFLYTILRFVVARRRLGMVVGSSYELRVSEKAARLPDLVVLLTEHMDRAENRRLNGAADIVVEVIAPDSVTRDRRDKMGEYAALGIPEYWIADPREGRQTFEIFVLDDEGYYLPTAEDADGRLNSTVIPGVWLDRRWLTAPQLPDESELALAMASAGSDTPVK